MTRVIVDEPLRSQLEATVGVAEICDTSGKTVGYFSPVVDPAFYEGFDCPVPAEELRRRMAAGGGRTLGEILADLNKHP